MKVLIAYDGSACAEAAIDDLYQAGLPETGDAHVISVAEVWLPPPDAIDDADSLATRSEHVEEIVRKLREKNEKILSDFAVEVKQAESRVRTALPGWKVTSSATYGSPAWEILAVSDEFVADLIVVGSHGQSALSRFFLGSISQKVLTEAHCSVRVARGRNQIDPAPPRIVVGFDGSRGATAAIDAIAARKWSDGTAVRLVSATEDISPSVVTSLIRPVVRMVEEVNLTEEHWIEQLAETALGKLERAGIKASLHLHSGNPKDIIVEEAESWSADCIFVGANAYGSRLQRALLGSTSAAVAARAHCSVEVVRIRTQEVSPSNGKPE